MKSLLGLATLGMTVVAWFFIERSLTRRQVERVLNGRPRLSEDEFFMTYYHASGIPKETIRGVLDVLGAELQLDVSRLLPADSFSGNLRDLIDSHSLEDVAIVEGLEKRFGVNITDGEAESAHTVHDIIVLMNQKKAVA